METSLKWPDYLILVSFLVISLAIGIYHSLTGGRQKTTEEFIMGNRRLKVIPTAMSLAVSYMSGPMILGMTAEMYGYGPQFPFLQLFSFMGSVIIAERLFVPWMYRQKLVSVNEFCIIRFGSNVVKTLATIIGILTAIFYMGLAMYAPSAALESATGLQHWVSIPSMSLICIAYTSLGGMKAVIWTDVFQYLTMVVGLLAIIIKGIIEVGGFGDVIRYVKDEGRMNFVDWSPDPTVRTTFWGIMISEMVNQISVYSITQASIQRYSAMKSVTKSRQTLMVSVPGTLIVKAITSFIGFIVVAYYAKIQCDPLKNKEIRNVNQMLPHFVISLFRDAPGFAGLFLATLYGASLSSVSSSLSGAAANCWEDILKRKLSHLPETTKAIINRILVIVFGLLATTVSFLVTVLPGPVSQIGASIMGSVIGPLLGIFMLGGLSRLPNWKGALTGGIIGYLVITWVNIGSLTVPNKYPFLPPLSIDGCSQNQTSGSFLQLFDDNCTSEDLSTTAAYHKQATVEYTGIQKFYCLSFCWYSPLGFLITFIVGFVVSLISRDREAEKAIEDKCLIKFKDMFTSWSNDDVEIRRGGDTQNSIDADLKKPLNEISVSTK